MLIYKATSPSGKSYIGLTTLSLNERRDTHIRNVNNGDVTHFYTAIKKYGIDNFIWCVIEDNVTDFEILKEREKFNILKYDTFTPNGYNMTLGGDGSYGRLPTKEQREKQRISMKGKNSRPMSEKQKEYYRILYKGRKNPEHSNRMKGIKLSKEQIEKISVGLKESWKLRKQRRNKI